MLKRSQSRDIANIKLKEIFMVVVRVDGVGTWRMTVVVVTVADVTSEKGWLKRDIRKKWGEGRDLRVKRR